MSQRGSDTESNSRSKSDQNVDKTPTNFANESKTDQADDSDDKKRVLIIKCTPGDENDKTVKLTISSNINQQADSFSSINQDNPADEQQLSNQMLNGTQSEIVSDDDKSTRKKRKLHFIDEVSDPAKDQLEVSDTVSNSRSKSDQSVDKTRTSFSNESKTDQADDSDDKKRVLIIRCKPSAENDKSTKLTIDQQADSSSSFDPDNSDDEQQLSNQILNEASSDMVSGDDKPKKKKRKLHFIDEVADAADDELEETSSTILPEKETELGKITTIEKKGGSYKLDRTSSSELKPGSSTTHDAKKPDVASHAKENTMNRMMNKLSEDTSQDETTLLDNTLASLEAAEELTEQSDKVYNLKENSAVSEVSIDSECSEESNKVLVGDLFKLMYLKSLKGYAALRRENIALHRRVAHYFKQRHMGFAFVESENPVESYSKYVQKLEELNRLTLDNQVRREYIEREVKQMVRQNEQLAQKANNDFQDLINREIEIGTGLIFSKSAKELTDGVIQSLVSNQRKKLTELQQIRVTHIKVRNAIAVKNHSLKYMEILGGNLTRNEYDRLNTLHRTYSEKVEERDVELGKLRRRCTGANTALAHIRERTHCAEEEMRELVEKSKTVDAHLREVRVEVNKIRMLRDKCRKRTYKLKEDSGLLAKDKLLMDMERCINRVKSWEDELAREQRRYALLNKKVDCLKYNYEREHDHMVFLSQLLPKTNSEVEAEKAEKRRSSRLRSFRRSTNPTI